MILLAANAVLLAADKELTGDRISARAGTLVVHPINHATLALGWQGKTIYVDPVGGAQRFAELPPPELVLLTDIHGDHLHAPTLRAIVGQATAIVAPAAVAELLPAELRQRTMALTNGQSREVIGLKLEALPAYNLSAERLQYHAKGRGNGYLITLGELRVYLSGDTEDIPEMRALKDIDVAFLCMNLPYTMEVEQAARAVRAFKPKIVYPYHYRGADLGKFKQLVGDLQAVEVRLRDWYPQ